MIAKIFTYFGYQTAYHICWQIPIAAGMSTGDGVYFVTPWLTDGNIRELKGELFKLHPDAIATGVNIISITRIGK